MDHVLPKARLSKGKSLPTIPPSTDDSTSEEEEFPPCAEPSPEELAAVTAELLGGGGPAREELSVAQQTCSTLEGLRQQAVKQQNGDVSDSHRGSLQPWWMVLKQRKYHKQAGGQKKGIMTLAETANKDSHFNTSPATAVQTSSAAVTANRQAEDNVPPQYYNPPIRHLFRGGFTVDKNTAETAFVMGKRSPEHIPRGTTNPWSRNSKYSLPLSFCSSTTNSYVGAADNGEYCTYDMGEGVGKS
ncbi:hypothetical protein NDU88_001777 [Pleurodeles waltl]|uniref:Uncharacterized protein n=1 Tax=Pleurodeles waltl TaxID=8319 RepID=A0AAV7KZG6_PLEWA|nr:hypothetical protein NDU88_001777 [Pleurodeles waltl]